jgi:uncharacterized membrane protein
MKSPRAATSQPVGQILSIRRGAICVAVGLAAAAAALPSVPVLAPLVGWIVAAGLALTWVWRISWAQGPAATKRLAEAESRSRSTDTAVLLAAVASLVAIVLAVVQSNQGTDPVSVVAVILALLASVASWALVNTVFALKYARLYYLDVDGGIDFKQRDPPAYSDFAYLAFTVGMSFAVSDTEPVDTRIRRTALGHALLSYAFGTVVLAVAINVVPNLGQG